MTMIVSPPTEARDWNGEFDFWKFVACLSILLVHTRLFYGGERLFFGNGHYAVELFFLLTGFSLRKASTGMNVRFPVTRLARRHGSSSGAKSRRSFPSICSDIFARSP